MTYNFESDRNRIKMFQVEGDPAGANKVGLITSFSLQEAAGLLKSLTMAINQASKAQEEVDLVRYKELKDRRARLAEQLEVINEQLHQMEITYGYDGLNPA